MFARNIVVSLFVAVLLIVLFNTAVLYMLDSEDQDVVEHPSVRPRAVGTVYAPLPQLPPIEEAVLVQHRFLLNENTTRGRECSMNIRTLPTGDVVREECVHIVVAATGSYMVPLLACMNSLQSNSERNLFFHLLTSPGETEVFVKSLVNLAQFHDGHPVEIVEFNDARVKPLIYVWEGKHMNVYYNTFNYARFYMPHLFPSVNNMVYLDPDTITNVDIGNLLDLFVNRQDKSKTLGAVQSKRKRTRFSTYCFLLNCEDEEVGSRIKNGMEMFFNAGVFVTDLRRWREEDVTGQLERWMQKNTQRKLWIWGSQPPLALVFYGKWMHLEWKWNDRELYKRVQKHFEKKHTINTYIYHFTGRHKPWSSDGRHVWSVWCPYYPLRDTLWFCRKGKWRNLIPSSLQDYRLVVRP